MNAKEIVLAGGLMAAVFAGALYWINSNQKPPEPAPAVAQNTTPTNAETAPAPRELDPVGPKKAGPVPPAKQGPAGNPQGGVGQPGGGLSSGKTIFSGPIGVKVVNSSSRTVRVVPLALGGNELRLPPNDLGIVWLQPGKCTLHVYYQSPAGKEIGPLSGSVTADGSKDIVIVEQAGKLAFSIR